VLPGQEKGIARLTGKQPTGHPFGHGGVLVAADLPRLPDIPRSDSGDRGCALAGLGGEPDRELVEDAAAILVFDDKMPGKAFDGDQIRVPVAQEADSAVQR